MNLKPNPTQQVVLVLALITAGSIFKNFNTAVLLHLAVTLGFALALFGLLVLITKKQKNIWNTIISALIICLLLHHGSLPVAITATTIAIFAKFFLEYKGLSIINPTVLGLLIASFIFDSTLISWWGASYQFQLTLPSMTLHLNFPLFILLIWILFGLQNWRKLPLLLTFLPLHLIALFIRQQELSTIKFVFTDATIYFLAAIMLVDPKSSPLLPRQQIIFAIIAALAYNLLAKFNIPNFELYAILVANLYFTGTRLLSYHCSTLPLKS